jgi:AraC-like DNA-binding protein
MRAASVAVSTRWTYSPPVSDWAQLRYASRGAIIVSTAGGVWVVPQHQAMWVPAGVKHSVETGAGCALRTLYVWPTLRRRLPDQCRAVNISPLLRELLRRALHLQTLDRRRPGQRHVMELLLDELQAVPLAPIDLPMPRDPRALRAARAIREKPDLPHSLADVARHAGASTRTLERLFREETGLTFGTWRQRSRLLRALQLLAEGENVTTTALAVGYESTSAFVAAFRRVLGATPGHYFEEMARS